MEKRERASFLAYFVFMKHHQVMSEMVEFELLQRRDNVLAVMAFVEYTESQNKYWVISIEGLHSMVPALIHVDDEIAEFPDRYNILAGF